MIVCGTCSAENPPGHKFCSNCGAALALKCPECGTENEAGHKFCFNCGGGLDEADAVAPSDSPPVDPSTSSAEPTRTERRFVSVLFADLVSFTTFSEHRDSEDVRAMLTLYFERSKEIIALYGGEIDKFIGDAVMGVWGAVESHEDDAERATRAALDLVQMVSELGAEIGVEELALRAGVLSGETAVGPGGNEKGLVVGDLVNTASRLQSIAPAGGVFVGASTRDLISANIETRPAGEHALKGKDVPVEAFEAVRIVSDPSKRASGEVLEGPFVGRDDELRLLKDQLHATGREGRARLVSIVGEGGIGKTRLAHELTRYIEGIAELIYSHHGRSPSYGDGVTFWALGEMVRQRAGIAEGGDPAQARIRLRTMVAEYVEDEEDQRWIEPRLAGLIGVAEMPPGDRSELFSALRAFFQHIAERGTVLMVFEDTHWADEGLIDFVDELVERTSKHPILVITLARPDLLDRRPDWGSSRKRMVSLHLSRLEDGPMRELVAGLAPGLPDDMVVRIADRTAGVPLHAVEFIRMLINTGELVREDDRFRFVGTGGDLAVPDSISAIIGARLDRLAPGALALVQDASVLGYSFTAEALATVLDEEVDSISPQLATLVKREVFEFEESPRSPERGQYRFVQSLIREVAYGRLTKVERASRHKLVADQMTRLDDPELAGIIASHLGSASTADPSDVELAQRALASLIAAADRATELHSDAQALRLFEQAIELSDDRSEALGLMVRSSRAAFNAALGDAHTRAETALEEYRAIGDDIGAAMAATEIAYQLTSTFRAADGLKVILPVYEETPQDDSLVWAQLASETARSLMVANRADESIEITDLALPVISATGDLALTLDTLITRGSALHMSNSGRDTEAVVLLLGAAEHAKTHGLISAQLRALGNILAVRRFDNASQVVEGILDLSELVARSGNMQLILKSEFFAAFTAFAQGNLEQAAGRLDAVRTDDLGRFWTDIFDLSEMLLRAAAGRRLDDDRARQVEIVSRYADSGEPQAVELLRVFNVQAAFLDGDFALARDWGVATPVEQYESADQVGVGLLSAALIHDVGSVRGFHELISTVGEGRALAGLDTFAHAFEAAIEGDEERASAFYREANVLWIEVGTPFGLALVRATMAQLLGRDSELGRQAGKQALAFFEGAGMQGYIDLFPAVFTPEIAADDELAG
jgi:class 3 adenylate cyclase